RGGLKTNQTPNTSGASGTNCFLSPSLGTSNFVATFGATNSEVFTGTTSRGVITGLAAHITECLFNGVTFVLITSTDGTGWFWASDATVTSISGDTHTNSVVDNIASTAGLYVGQKVSGTGFTAGTRIASITSGTA